MKKVSIITSALVFFAAVFAQAQTARLAQTSYLKQARQQLEKDNEQKILEMLETQRLQEEKNRMQRIEGLSFSVVNSAPTVPEQTTSSQTF